MALSAFFFALMAAVAKLLGKRISAQEVILVRGVLNVAFMAWWLRRKELGWRGNRPWLLMLRGVLGYTALSCYFWSVSRQSLATAILLQQVHPVFTAVLAIWFLGERPGSRFLPASPGSIEIRTSPAPPPNSAKPGVAAGSKAKVD